MRSLQKKNNLYVNMKIVILIWTLRCCKWARLPRKKDMKVFALICKNAAIGREAQNADDSGQTLAIKISTEMFCNFSIQFFPNQNIS